jgi:serine/threonine protein kinase
MDHSVALTIEEELALDNAIADYLARVDRGEPVDLSTFLSQHGSLAPALREFLETADLLTEMVATATPPQLVQGLKDTTRSSIGEETLPGDDALDGDSLVPPVTGVRFGRYLLLGPLGEGMTGTVHLAYDTALERLVAIKMPTFEGALSAAARERFFRGARLAATLKHRHICPIFDVGEINGLPFLSMGYIDGSNLAQALEKEKFLPLPRVLELIRKLAEALNEAHARNVIHRDLKPANVMVDSHGEPVLTDFGMARRLGLRDTQLTHTGTLIGTPVFMSPEQLEGSSSLIGPPTDIYSLGVIFYQLLTGILPFNGTFISVAVQVRHGKPVPPTLIRPELNALPGLEAVCLKMMAKRPEKRYASMADVVRAIEALEQNVAATVTHESASIRQADPTPPPVHETQTLVTPKASVANESWSQNYLWCGVGAVGMLVVVTAMIIGNGVFFDTPRPQPEIVDAPSNPVLPHLPHLTKDPGNASPAPPSEADRLPDLMKSRQLPNPVVQEKDQVIVKDDKPLNPSVKPTFQRAASVGDGFNAGVVRLVIPVPADVELRFRPDLPCRITSADGKVLYPAYKIELRQDQQTEDDLEEGATAEFTSAPVLSGAISQITASFLCLDDEPLAIAMYYGETKLVTDLKVTLSPEPADHDELLAAWWTDYTLAPAEALNAESRLIKMYLQVMLARRLGLPAAKSIPLPNDDASALERYFERSVSMFLGFDSVKSALGTEGWSQRAQREPLTQSLPPAPRLPPVPFPRPGHVSIEAIASHAPDDCIYLHCRSLDNYLWFRELLVGWGGSLDEVVASKTRDRGIRQRLEQQLALVPDADVQASCKQNVDDIAMIFGDSFFEDGAAVGVLLQAKRGSGPALRSFLDHRRRLAAKAAGVSEQPVTFERDAVSLIASSDKQLLSYYAISGDYHFVTNSEYLMRRFFQAGRGERNLAKLEEFRYARSKVKLHRDQTVFLYMSDPFFTRMISPACQIELARRAEAKADVQHLQLALLAAQAEGRTPKWARDLIDESYLPTRFGQRSDSSFAELRGTAVDSARGVPGTFVPVCDMEITKITRSEFDAYQKFLRSYAQQWRRMDPVSCVIAHRDLQNGRQAVDIEIAITPYAQGKYAELQRSLRSPGESKIESPPGDLLSLNAALQTQQGDRFLAYAGLSDADIQFAIKDGRVQIKGLSESQTYAGQNYHLVFDTDDQECLWSMLRISNSLGATTIDVDSARAAKSTMESIGRSIGRLPLLVVSPERFWNPGAPRQPRLGWQTLSPRADLEQAKHRKVASSDDAQARLRLRELQGSRVEPYIQAYTYLEARRASARNAALLDLTMQQFCLDASKAPQAIERIHRAKTVCPLGGELTLKSNAAGFRSDRWPETSLYDERETPANYRFAFMDWLRGLDVGFALENQTLKADVRLELQTNK